MIANAEPLRSFHPVSGQQQVGAYVQQHCPACLSTSVVVLGSAGSSSARPAAPPVWIVMELTHEANLLTATLVTVLRCAQIAAYAASERQGWTSDTK